MPKTSAAILSTLKKHKTETLVTSCVECCKSTISTASCYRTSSQCIPVQKFVSVSPAFSHNRSPWVSDSDKGVCWLSPLLFIIYMNWINSHSRFEGVTVGSCRINRLLFADDLVLLVSSEWGLRHELDRLPAACSQAEIKISTRKTEVLCFYTKPGQCMLKVSRNTPQ